MMHDRERLHWLHRVRSYEMKRGYKQTISVGKGEATQNFQFPVILGETATQQDIFEPV
jgi:hypothetical protein